MARRDTPPVLVIHGDNIIGLTLIRSLGPLAPVIAMASRDGVGRYSRYCSSTLPRCPNPELAGQVEEIVRRRGVSHVFATAEDTIVFLNRARERLEKAARLMFPPEAVFDLALHKDRTLEIAAETGIPVPKTIAVRSREDLVRCRELVFPVALKPAHGEARLGFKVDYASTFDDLEAKILRLEEWDGFPLVQEFLPGKGLGVEALIVNGEAVALFQHRRLHEYPPKGGVSVYCESVPLEPELARLSVALLKAMNWEGVAMVEYRRDPSTGRTLLMEVNGRFWGSLPLAVQAGIDFPALWYRASLDPAEVESFPRSYRTGIRCRVLPGHSKWLYSVLRDGSQPRVMAIAGYIRALAPDVRNYIWRWSDPLPGIMNFLWRFPGLWHTITKRFSR